MKHIKNFKQLSENERDSSYKDKLDKAISRISNSQQEVIMRMKLGIELTKALEDYHDTGKHWDSSRGDSAVEKKQLELVKKYPTEKKMIDDVFSDIGDLANMYSQHSDGKDDITEKDLTKAYNAVVKKITTGLNEYDDYDHKEPDELSTDPSGFTAAQFNHELKVALRRANISASVRIVNSYKWPNCYVRISTDVDIPNDLRAEVLLAERGSLDGVLNRDNIEYGTIQRRSISARPKPLLVAILKYQKKISKKS